MSTDVARANWNFTYEKGLVDILLDHKDNPRFKGQNGWVPEGWRVITTKFNDKFPLLNYTKHQLQEKEKELKGNYKAIRDAKKNSGGGWDESTCMILAEPIMWEKLIKDNKKLARLRKKPFPLFYLLESLYEGSVATGDLNFTSTPAHSAPPAPAHFAPPAHAHSAPLLPAHSAPSPAHSAPPAPAHSTERSTSERSLQFGANPFDDSSEAQSSRLKRCKQSHIGAAVEGYVEFRKSQTKKNMEDLEEKKRHDAEFSIEKCLQEVDAASELTDDEKSFCLELIESETQRDIHESQKQKCSIALGEAQNEGCLWKQRIEAEIVIFVWIWLSRCSSSRRSSLWSRIRLRRWRSWQQLSLTEGVMIVFGETDVNK